MCYGIGVLMAAMMMVSSAVAWADDSRSVNFIIFEKSQTDFEYDPIMFGGFSAFIRAMEGSQLLLLSHGANAISGDVINLQQDVLKESASGRFDDVGVNCQLSFSYDGKGNELEYQLSGDCQIHGRFQGEVLKLDAHIPTTDLPDSAMGDDVWIEVYEDKKSGIAFYANVSKH